MQNIKLTIEYDGTHFKGRQIQPRNQRTVQATIINTFQNIFREKIKLIGSGRTDSGVHALGQVANFQTSISKSPQEIRGALNAHLPVDISIIKAQRVPDNFHAQYSTKSKTYRYTILNRETRSAIFRTNALLFPHRLDVNLMKAAAQDLVGTKDFKSFKGNNRSAKKESTIRTINSLKISKKGEFIIIEISADGFLYKMVRNIVGTLLEVGAGSIPKDCIDSILQHKDRRRAAYTAKACGLSLVKVQY